MFLKLQSIYPLSGFLEGDNGDGDGDGDGDGGDGGGEGDAAAKAAAAAEEDAAVKAENDAQGPLAKAREARIAKEKEAAGVTDDGENKGRPKDIPEQFWNPEANEGKGELKTESLVKSWKDGMDTIKDLNTKLKAGKSDIPKTAEDYKLELPEDSDVSLDADDPGIKIMQTIAHEEGLTQDQFNNVVIKFLSAAMKDAPEPEAELKKLGPNADAMVTAVEGHLNHLKESGIINEWETESLMNFGNNAGVISALNKIREQNSELKIPMDVTIVEGAKTPAELFSMQGDKRYGVDTAYTQMVQAEFEKTYGTKPAGTSRQNVGVSDAIAGSREKHLASGKT